MARFFGSPQTGVARLEFLVSRTPFKGFVLDSEAFFFTGSGLLSPAEWTQDF